MQMTGEQHIAASRQKVWDALNDPAVLAQCIPGCQTLDRDGEDRFTAVAEVKIGPIGARFKGNVQLGDIDAPNGCTITGSGNGGIAGSAKGGAKVRLADAPGGGTLVAYEVEAEVGGRMAQLGGPIIDATAKNLAGKFFTKFGEVVGGTAQASAGTLPGAGSAEIASASTLQASVSRVTATPPAPLWGWVAALVAALLAGFALAQSGASGSVMLVVAVMLILTAAAGYAAGRRGGRP
ncbi:carbon monoxide dehydrogenase subunit G [Sphingomonas sp. LH128]|jgi:carbon monoxide dehydrogenase subunit G|uniref:CoxG family protein n=1 Tax=Sphingomonas sp. LH128 TaxID=473781 RepID=UPI00027CB4DE|nr:carbon monoxide dehydrogenase subunit G [Sphingomonas sp. LH128]EJU14488.1 carbon monoxide dehydrogenase subunit G [Sphingomonas sp. LH128]